MKNSKTSMSSDIKGSAWLQLICSQDPLDKVDALEKIPRNIERNIAIFEIRKCLDEPSALVRACAFEVLPKFGNFVDLSDLRFKAMAEKDLLAKGYACLAIAELGNIDDLIFLSNEFSKSVKDNKDPDWVKFRLFVSQAILISAVKNAGGQIIDSLDSNMAHQLLI